MKAIAHRDPTGQGLPSPIAFRLLWDMLSWDEESRPTAAEALQHAFFVWPLLNQTRGDVKCAERPQKGWC